jgi:hypothetical protein
MAPAMRTCLAGLALLGLAALGGCQRLECAEGTFEDGDRCVGFDPSDHTPPVTTLMPAGGRSRTPIPKLVTLTTDEPARIHYTIDGSDPSPADPGEASPVGIVGITQGTTLKYFAIDPAGNREELTSVTFDYDVTPPAQVSGLTLTMTGADAMLRWTNPGDADYAGTVVARVTDVIDVDPNPGQTYTAPVALSPSLQILAAGKTTQLADPARPAGPVRYVAWTYDDLGNYSAPVSVGDAVPLGSLTAQYTYNTANNMLTRVAGPAHLDLADTTATLAGATLTLTLKVKNNSSQYFQNFKAEVTSVTNAAFTASDGTADGFPFRTLGPGALAPGATVTRDLVFTGVAAGSTVTLNLTFASHASILCTAGRNNQQQNLVDLGSGLPLPIIIAASRGPNDRATGRIRPGRLIGGHYLDIPTTHATIERWDLVTWTRKTSPRLAGDDERANIQGIYTAGPTTFALIKYGGRRRTAKAELVRIDEGLHVTGRLDLQQLEGRGFGRAALSADNATMAIPVLGGVVLVDTKRMALIDATPNTPTTIDPIEPGFTTQIRAVQFFDNDKGLVILSRFTQAAFVRRTADDYTVTPYQESITNARGYSLATAPDGQIWMAFSTGIRAFNPANNQVSTITYTPVPNGLSMVDNAMWIVRSDRISLDQVSPTGAVQRTITLPANAGAYGHWLAIGR